MTKFETGKLYKCPGFHLLVYPTATKAAVAVEDPPSVGSTSWTRASHFADYWSKELNCKVRYSNPEDPMMFIEGKEINGQRFSKFLFPEFEGWVIWDYWLEFE